MSDTWKQTERAIARKLGGKRTPLSGALDGRADVVTPWLAIEVKSKRRLPNWLKSAMQQAERAARAGQLPVVVLHEQGVRHRNDLIVMRLGDFTDWFGSPTAPAADGGASGAGAEEDGD